MKYLDFNDFIETEKKNCWFSEADLEGLIAEYSDILHSAFEDQRDNKYVIRRPMKDGKMQVLKYKNIFDALILSHGMKDYEFYIDREFKF